MDVREKLLELMKARGWSYYRLAKASDMSWSTIRNMFERGTEPTLPTLEAICKGLDITLADLLVGYSVAELSEEQSDVLENWEKLDSEDKELCLRLLKSLSRKKR